eukprot:6630483-Prymnesium_polylepis.2
MPDFVRTTVLTQRAAVLHEHVVVDHVSGQQHQSSTRRELARGGSAHGPTRRVTSVAFTERNLDNETY